MQQGSRLGRRSLLGNVGLGLGLAGLGSAGLLSALESQVVQAQSGVAPKRLCILLMPNCNQQHFWLPQGGRYPEMAQGVAKDFVLGTGYQALEAVRADLTVVEGLSMDVKGADAHSAGVIRFMTGGGVSGGGSTIDDPKSEWALQPSIDQVLLSASPALQGTRFASLDLIADDRQETANPIYVVLSWGKDGQPRFSERRPEQVFDRFFAGAELAGEDPAAQLKLESSVLDAVKGDLADLYARVPVSERPQLDSHLAGIGELEATLNAVIANQGLPLPPRPSPLEVTDSSNHPGIIDAHFKLARSALQLDLTRVVTLAYASTNNFADFASILGGSQFSENITYPFASFGVHALAHRDENIQSATLQTITDWYMQRTVEFVQLLAATPDTDGSRLLDNTLVVLFSETSEGHAHDNIPLLMFGGKNLGVQGNRLLRYPGRTPADLWTAIAPLYGVDLATFGDADQNRGRLPELI